MIKKLEYDFVIIGSGAAEVQFLKNLKNKIKTHC